MNTTWHEKHPMPRGASRSERLAWHLAHQKHCACRPVPRSLRGEVTAQSPDLPTPRASKPAAPIRQRATKSADEPSGKRVRASADKQPRARKSHEARSSDRASNTGAARTPRLGRRAKGDEPSDVAPPGELMPLIAAFESDPAVTFGGGGFGSRALKYRGKLFAMLVRQGDFVVKLPRTRVDQLMAAGEARPFETGAGRVMREWLVTTWPAAKWLALAREAYAYVKELER